MALTIAKPAQPETTAHRRQRSPADPCPISYIGDICRMGILGEPDDELQDYLARIDSVQKAAREACRPGTKGRQIYQAAKLEIAAAALATPIEFVAHGMGLVSHEAPQLTSSGDVRYNADYEDKGIRPGMVLSIDRDDDPPPATGFH